MRHEFSAVLLPLPTEIQELCLELAERIQPRDRMKPAPRLKDFHISAHTGLWTNDVEDVRFLLHGFNSIGVRLKGVSCFEANYKVFQRAGAEWDCCKIDVESLKLTQLNEYLNENLEHTNRFSTFAGHIAIGWVPIGSGLLYSGSIGKAVKDFSIDTATFINQAGESWDISLASPLDANEIPQDLSSRPLNVNGRPWVSKGKVKNIKSTGHGKIAVR